MLRSDPRIFMANGAMLPNPKQPKRIAVLHAAARDAGCSFAAPSDHGMGPLAAIHSPEYLHFLQTIHPRWSQIEGASDEVIPNVHPDRRGASYPRSAVGQVRARQPIGRRRPHLVARMPCACVGGALWDAVPDDDLAVR
ncbi:hypothetical protein [Yoonia sp.]|uniref:hypothetical protein n=1 Tax=Yoonia sp. TaxID=2212373 RepID=UPI0019F29A88|nr:hypothetical protein [Yoonia sp.]